MYNVANSRNFHQFLGRNKHPWLAGIEPGTDEIIG
jgi:hypothetical protein